MIRKTTLSILLLMVGIGFAFAQNRVAPIAPHSLDVQVRPVPTHNATRAAGDTIVYLGFDGADVVDTVAAPGFGGGFFDVDMESHSITLQNAGYGVASDWLIFQEVLAPGDTNLFAGISSWFTTTNQSSDWITMGPIVVPANGADFSWEHQIGDNGFRDGYEVLLGTTGSDPADFATSTTLLSFSDNDAATDGDTTWTLNSVSLDAATYAGDTIYLAVHHNATDMFLLFFDDLLVTEAQGASVAGGGPCSDLFFSEYIEGSSNNKALEVYNPTSGTIDLSDYAMIKWGNGGSSPLDTTMLSGMLAPSDVYVAVAFGADPAMLAVADDTLSFPSAVHFNGDDAVILVNLATGDTLDMIGDFGGVDPGSNWPVDTGSTKEYTLVRKMNVLEGSLDWAVGATQWDVNPQNTFSFLGSHMTVSCSACQDLFFSEYIEGSSNNKGFEIYNPTMNAIDLADYDVVEWGNGGNFIDTLELSGMLAAGDVFVAVTDAADPAMQAAADVSLGFPSVTHFNGDDALVLINRVTGDTLDAIGIFGGPDPGSSWPVDTGSTKEYTLVRKMIIDAGTKDWAVGATQWDVYPQNTFSFLGSHVSTACGGMIPSPTISFASGAMTVNEAAGTVSFDVVITSTTADTAAVDVSLGAGTTATMGTDFTWTNTTIDFPGNATMPITLSVTINDDAMIEPNEDIEFVLSNPTNGAVLGTTANMVITIEDNDTPIPAYAIGLVTADANNDGLGDSLGITCQLQGVVHGVDMNGGGSVQFTFIDATGGIGVFSGNDYGYVVTEGDEVILIGDISAFNGLTQMSPDTIIFVSSGNTLQVPTVVTQLSEATESEMTTAECFKFVDPTAWDASGSSFNISVTNNTDTLAIRIDGDVDLAGTANPIGNWFNFTGIGGQFDSSLPHLDGYQLLPRYSTDVLALSDPSVGFDSTAKVIAEAGGMVTVGLTHTDGNPDITSVTVELNVASSTATEGTDFAFTTQMIDFTGKGTSTDNFDVTIMDDANMEADETIVLDITTVTNNGATNTSTVTITITDDDAGAIEILASEAIGMYPNPGKNRLVLESSVNMETITLTNMLGQEVARIAPTGREVEVATSTLPSGTYLVRIITQDGIWSQKWIKE